MSKIFNSADIAETMNNGVANVTGADSTITENYSNVVQHGIKIDMSVSEKTISGAPPLTFNSNGTPLIDYIIYGNSVQDGTPTPDDPVAVNGVGTVSNGNYTLPIRTNTITNINLNSVPTTRKIKKLVLIGDERWELQSINSHGIANFLVRIPARNVNIVITHFKKQISNIASTTDEGYLLALPTGAPDGALYLRINSTTASTVNELRTWLAEQNANGTPVTVWYVLTTPETGIVNEPLMKIGDYADSVSYAQSSVTIPTASGNNTIDVQTTPKPSNMTITYKGR